MHWTLDAVPESAASARDIVRGILASIGKGEDGMPALLVYELVANAVLHGNGPVELDVDTDVHRLRVEVSDGAPLSPVHADRIANSDQRSGLGLDLVNTLSTRWGVEAESVGKTIWFELDWKG